MTPAPLLSAVANRGTPPAGFITELVRWGQGADPEIFEPNPATDDIYASVANQLGPYTSFLHRKAVMLEVLRVLAGFESSWNWNEGRDSNNPSSNRPETEEAGAWQVSANSQVFGADLRALVASIFPKAKNARDISADDFRRAMKYNHPFAMEYAARLLRHTIRHNGPVKRGEIHRWLKREAVDEFIKLL